MAASIAVVGSTNLDLMVPVKRHPRPGETVIGDDHHRVAGGKGANQAVACARLGAQTRFVGCVGDDEPAQTLRAALEDAGVDLAGLRTLDVTPSGLALIVVDHNAENTIVVSPGANARLNAAHVRRAGVHDADALLVQLEVPLEAVTAAIEATHGLVVLNPAPAAALPPKMLEHVDVLVPNRGELAALAGAREEPSGIDEVVDLARSLEGIDRIVTTLGADGAVAVEGDTVTMAVPQPATAVDSTGAGDAFCGALTVALVEGATLGTATRWATIAAGLAVTRHGAQPAMATRAEVEAAAPPGLLA